MCLCPEGFAGDPFVKCQPIECLQDSECPSNHQCLNQKCQDSCSQIRCVTNAECRATDHVAKCYCQAGYKGDPDHYCSLIPVPDCKLDHDCSASQGCLDGRCVDLCEELQPCSSGAVCQVLNTKPVKAMSCVCPAGYSGDPQFACVPGMFFILIILCNTMDPQLSRLKTCSIAT